MFESLGIGYTWADAIIKANASAAKPDLPEWERRPFALSKPEYYTQSYPGTRRAQLMQALKEHATSEKEKSE